MFAHGSRIEPDGELLQPHPRLEPSMDTKMGFRRAGRALMFIATCVFLSAFVAGSTFGQTPERRRAIRHRAIEPVPRIVVVNDDFRAGLRGWTTGFADYSPVHGDLGLVGELRPLPIELGVGGTGLMMTGQNSSDDLFMFLTKRLGRLDGIVPNQPYEVVFTLTFASNVGENCGGIGGSPGDSVYLKAGATGDEPRVVLDPFENHYRMTVDIGNQSVGGAAASVAGNIVNGSMSCSGDAPFASVTLHHQHTSIVTSDPLGDLWLLVGTDSGFEGRTTLYYQSISAVVIPLGSTY